MQNVRNRLWTIAFFIPAEFSGVKEYGQFCRLVLAGGAIYVCGALKKVLIVFYSGTASVFLVSAGRTIRNKELACMDPGKAAHSETMNGGLPAG